MGRSLNSVPAGAAILSLLVLAFIAEDMRAGDESAEVRKDPVELEVERSRAAQPAGPGPIDLHMAAVVLPPPPEPSTPASTNSADLATTAAPKPPVPEETVVEAKSTSKVPPQDVRKRSQQVKPEPVLHALVPSRSKQADRPVAVTALRPSTPNSDEKKTEKALSERVLEPKAVEAVAVEEHELATVPEIPAESEELPAAEPVRVDIDQAAAPDHRAGRTFLRLMEQGNGPRIVLAWPESRSQQQDLFRQLRSCLGMRTGLLTANNQLFLHDGVANRDLVSGFVRTPQGFVSPEERQEKEYLERRFGRGHLVRVFPRQSDAALIGGLRRIAGPAYGDAAIIRAQYRLSANGVALTDLNADGKSLDGRLLVGSSSHCGEHRTSEATR